MGERVETRELLRLFRALGIWVGLAVRSPNPKLDRNPRHRPKALKALSPNPSETKPYNALNTLSD